VRRYWLQSRRPQPQEEGRKRHAGEVARYSGVRLLSLAITVVIGVYLTILIANMAAGWTKSSVARSAKPSTWPWH